MSYNRKIVEQLKNKYSEKENKPSKLNMVLLWPVIASTTGFGFFCIQTILNIDPIVNLFISMYITAIVNVVLSMDDLKKIQK